ncbi:hypothetical protein GH733_007258 [Mirounga leonina]|nr:hypothetical protein GH733_007258 [Mirounga leonina]
MEETDISGFINRNDIREDVFVHQTAIKKKNLGKGTNASGRVGAPGQGRNYAEEHILAPYQNSESGERRRGGRVFPEARPHSTHPAQATEPTCRCGDPTSGNHCTPPVLCRGKGWRVLTSRVQESKVNQ